MYKCSTKFMFTASTDNHSISTPLETIHKYVNYKYSLAYIQVYMDGQVPSDTPGCTERVGTPGCTGWADTPGCTGTGRYSQVYRNGRYSRV